MIFLNNHFWTLYRCIMRSIFNHRTMPYSFHGFELATRSENHKSCLDMFYQIRTPFEIPSKNLMGGYLFYYLMLARVFNKSLPEIPLFRLNARRPILMEDSRFFVIFKTTSAKLTTHLGVFVGQPMKLDNVEMALKVRLAD